MATFGQIQEFQPESESFAAYMEHMELFPPRTTFQTGRRRHVFLSVVGVSTYELLCNLVAPASPKDKSFDEIVDMLKAHFEPKPIIIVERYHFHRWN